MRRLALITCILFFISSLIYPVPAVAKSSIDIVFIIDRSGSMGGEINAVKNEIGDFVDLLENQGVDYQLGLITYEKSVHRYDLTNNVNIFKNYLSSVDVDGGTENGLDAIMDAINNYTYELNSSKYFVLIGDEKIESRYGYSLSSVKQALISNDITLTAIGYSKFKDLSDATGGLFLDLNSNFSDSLTSIFDQIQMIPILEIISPTPNQVISDLVSFVPTVKVTDPDSDTLNLAYYIDSETTPRETKNGVTNNKTAQTISFNALNIGSLSEGAHTMRFTVNDGSDTVQDIVSIKVDKSPPSLGTVSVTSTDTSISMSGSASDNISGMDPNPYRYTVGSSASAWTSNTSYAKSGLIPNTSYQVKFEAKDKVGHIASKVQTIHTKAQVPTITISGSTENSLQVSFSDSNPGTTQYVLSVGSKYVNAMGQLTTSPVWISPSGKKITVTGLSPNTQYSFRAKAKNQQGVETSYSSNVNGKTLASPPTLENITVKAQQRSINITWPSSSGATGYDVQVDGVVINNGTSTTYNHSGLSPNTQHTYRIRVRNAGGAGNWSALLTVQTLPDPPAVPVNLNAQPAQTEVVLTWEQVVNAESYDLEADGNIIDVGNNTAYVHGGLTPETDHIYRIRAKNAGGISEWSQPLTVKTLPYPPEAPVSIVAQPTINNVTITWQQVERATAYEIEVDGLILENGANTTYIHEGLEPLSGHTYRVRAKNAGGKSPWSIPIDVTTLPEIPDIPANIMTTAEEEAITVTWYKVPFAEGYEVEIDGATTVSVSDTMYVHNGLSPDSRHTYRVRAKNISGLSEWSVPVTMMTLPENNDPTMSLTNVVAVVTNKNITVSWDAVAFEAEYDVEVDGILLNNGKETIYNHTGLEPNQYHTYKIRVKTQEGTSQWVAVLSLATLPNPPDAPTNIEAFATTNTIELRWDKVENATGYDLEVDGETVDVGPNETYTHSGLEPGTAHTYRVRAKNVTGVTAWSPAITQSTTSPTYVVNVTNNTDFEFSLFAMNVQDFSEHTFVVTYNPDEIDVVDLYNFTPEADVLQDGIIPGTNISVVYNSGRIEFKFNKNIVPGTSWSGELTTIMFKSKIDGQTSIDFVVE